MAPDPPRLSRQNAGWQTSSVEASYFLDKLGSELEKPAIDSRFLNLPGGITYEQDVTGDLTNVKYGKPYQFSIPRYRRSTNRVVGHPGWRIRQTAKSEVYIESSSISRDSSLLAPHAIPKLPIKMIGLKSDENLLDTVFSLDDNDTDQNAYLSALLQQRATVQRHLDHDPHDVDSWLQMVSCERTIQRYSKAGKREEYDAVEAIFARALSINRANEGLMTAFARHRSFNIAPEHTMSSFWREAITIEPTENRHWLRWVDSIIDESHRLHCLDILELDVLRSGIFDLLNSKLKSASSGDAEVIESIYVQLLFRVCLWLMQSGYTESAFGAFQAALELTFFYPEDSENLETEELLSMFSRYWELETPRIGDPQAKGWRNTTEKTRVLLTDLQHRVPGWPLRTTDVDGESLRSDPFSVVLFDDIRPMLRRVNTSPAREDLMWAFAGLLGYSVPGHEFVRPTAAHIWNETSDTLSFDSVLECSLNLLLRSPGSHSSKFWRWAIVFFGSKVPEKLASFCKRLLKISENRSNMVLWGQYAAMELTRDSSKGRQIVEGGFQMLEGRESSPDYVAFWNSWALTLLRSCFASFNDVKFPLDLKQPLTEQEVKSILDRKPMRVGTVDESADELLRALIIRLLEMENIAPQLRDEVLERSLSPLKPICGDDAEILHSTRLVVFYYAAVYGAVGSGIRVVRNFLNWAVRGSDGAVDQEMVHMLAIFDNRYGRSISDRIVRLGSEEPGNYSWLVYDLATSQTTSGQRRAFEDCLKHCDLPHVYEAYIDFELKSKDGGDVRARSILRRAVTKCRWSVGLGKYLGMPEILDGFGPLEKEGLLKSAKEQGLRMPNILVEG